MSYAKKWFIVLSLVLLSFVVVACTPQETSQNQLPVFSGVGAIQINQGSTFNPLTGVSATDPEDGTLTTAIVVSANTVNTAVPGTYSVTYTVEDSNGGIKTVERAVFVLAVAPNLAPVFNGVGPAQVIFEGTFDPLAGVVAIDPEDGNITANIVVVSNNVNTALEGVYQVSYSITDSDGEVVTANRQVTVTPNPNIAPVLGFGYVNAPIAQYSQFNPLLGMTAIDAEDGNLTDEILVTGTVNSSIPGDYTITYTVTDSDGAEATHVRVVTVEYLAPEDYPLAQYLSGVDYSKIPSEQRGILFAAMERYLLENVYGGVPLYSSAARVMYASRVQLFSPTYNGLLGFGVAFSQFSADDSTVQLFEGQTGNAGEYTYRSAFTINPTSLNPWTADDSNSSDFIDYFTGSLYSFYFDETKAGYEILGELADGEPVPTDSYELYGKTYAPKWTITLKEGLKWTYHPGTDLTGMPAGHDVFDANDYYNTWKFALQQNWLRARTGGGDFITWGIKGAETYLNNPNETNWENVGIKLIDDLTIELEFSKDQTAYEIKSFLSGNLQALNLDLYDKLGAANYGQGPTSVAASGIYYFDQYTPNQLLTFKKNTQHPLASMYHYTGYQFRYFDGETATAAIFAEFLAGRMESASIPPAEVNNYLTDPRVKTAPDATTWRLVINAFGTPGNRDAFEAETGVNVDNTWVPEPILQYVEARKALYYGFDRYDAAVNIVKTYLPQHTLFTDIYFLDGESGIPVRGTPEGAAVRDDFGGSTYGYVPEAAVIFWKQAVAKAIGAGYYTKGTAENPTIITLELYWQAGASAAGQLLVDTLVQKYEDLLFDDVNFVGININVNTVAHPNQYYQHMMVAKMDLGIGGIKGGVLDAPGFMDVFSADNRGGFTLNWGIDTSTPNIPVVYTNADGILVAEKWSYDAIFEALNGKSYIQDGVERSGWDDGESLIEAYLDMISGSTIAQIKDGSNLAETLNGDLEDLAIEEGYESVEAYIVVDSLGTDILFILGVTDEGVYELISQDAIYAVAADAIKAGLDSSGGAVFTVSSAVLLDDAGVAANAYLGGPEGYATVAEVLEDNKADLTLGQVWAISWSYSGGSGSDAVILLFVDGYYVFVTWL